MAVRSPKHGLTRNGRGWIKRINGKPRWICSLKAAPTPEAADAWYEKNMTDLWTVVPAPTLDGDPVTVALVADHWDAERRAANKITRERLDECEGFVRDFIGAVGGDTIAERLEPHHFAKAYKAWAKRFGPYRLRKAVKAIRQMLAWARGKPLGIGPVGYGDAFTPPSKTDLRKHKKRMRETHGPKMFKRADLAALLKAARPTMRAMILLALNGGYGNTDVAELPLTILDLDARMLDYTRGKTGADRRVPLWPETIIALRDALAYRASILSRLKRRGLGVYKGAEGLVFLTNQGQAFITPRNQRRPKDRVGERFGELVGRLDLLRHGRNFYSLRRTFRTHADAAGDPRAVDVIMGHVSGDMGGEYVQEVFVHRLKKVVRYARRKTLNREARELFGTYKAPPAASPDVIPPGAGAE